MSGNKGFMKKPGYHKNTKGYNPNTYISIQDKVNLDPSFRAEYFQKLSEEGWSELEDINDIMKVKSNTQFKYRLAPHKTEPGNWGFRSGGFLSKIGQNREFITYRAFNGCVFTLQIADIRSFYIKQ